MDEEDSDVIAVMDKVPPQVAEPLQAQRRRKRAVEKLPLTAVRKPRVAGARPCASAEDRLPSTWIVRFQQAGIRCPTCLHCKESIGAGSLKIGRQSDLATGGRWFHRECLPGGFRQDDSVESDDTDPLPAVVAVVAEQAARRVPQGSSSATQVPAQTPMTRELPELEASAGADDVDWGASQDVLADDVWTLALRARLPMLSEVPQHLRAAYFNCKAALCENVVRATQSPDPESLRQSWWRLLLFDKLVAHMGGDKGDSLNSKIRHRYFCRIV